MGMDARVKLKSFWIRGYGSYYVTAEKKQREIGQVFVKSIRMTPLQFGIALDVEHWDGTSEILYTNHGSVKFGDNSKEEK